MIIGMLKRISVLLLAALVMVALIGNVALAAPDIKGCSETGTAQEPCDTGSPTDPSCWGEATSQFTSQVQGPEFGQHAANPPGEPDQPRKGVGNVARNDGGTATDPNGTRPSDHGAVVGPAFGSDCSEPAGNPGGNA